MEKTAIQKINGLGKAAFIISKIAKVFLIIAAVTVALVTVLTCFMPQDFLNIRVSSHADITLNYGTIGKVITDIGKLVDEESLDDDWVIGESEFEVESIVQDGDRLNLSANADAIHFGVWHLRIALIAGLLFITAVCVGTHFLCKLFQALSVCTTPFEEGIIQKMRHLAIALIPVSIISSSTQSMIDSLQTGNISININIDFTQVVVILVLFALVYIFKLGAELQRQSDETL